VAEEQKYAKKRKKKSVFFKRGLCAAFMYGSDYNGSTFNFHQMINILNVTNYYNLARKVFILLI